MYPWSLAHVNIKKLNFGSINQGITWKGRRKKGQTEAFQLWRQKKKEAMLCINLHLLEMLVFNFVYYDSNDELRVDEEAILRMDPNSDNYESWQEASYFFK